MPETTQAIAARCLQDPEFAQQVLAGEEYPEVKQALVADLQGTAEVQGHWFQNNTFNGQKITVDSSVVQQWKSFSWPTLTSLAGYPSPSSTDNQTFIYQPPTS